MALLLGVDLAEAARSSGLAAAGVRAQRLLTRRPTSARCCWAANRFWSVANWKRPCRVVRPRSRCWRGHDTPIDAGWHVEAEGPAAALGGNVLVVDDRVAAAILGQPGRVSRLDLMLDPEVDRDQVRRRLETELAGQAAVTTLEAQDRRDPRGPGGSPGRVLALRCGSPRHGALPCLQRAEHEPGPASAGDRHPSLRGCQRRAGPVAVPRRGRRAGPRPGRCSVSRSAGDWPLCLWDRPRVP